MGPHYAWLSLLRRLLEVAVGDGPGRILCGHEVLPHVERELKSPHVGLQVLVEEDSAEYESGGIRGPQERRVFRN